MDKLTSQSHFKNSSYVQYSSHLSWHLRELNTYRGVCVLQFLLSDSLQTCMWHATGCTWVNFHVLHSCYILCAECDPYFMCCMIVRKKHTSNTSCAPHELAYLCAACTQINSHALPEKNQGKQWNGTLAKHDRIHKHEENSILSSIYILLFQSILDDIVLNQLNAKHNNGTRFRQYEH